MTTFSILNKKQIFSFALGLLICNINAQYKIIINEMMIDPSPVVGMPNAEFIELKNVDKQDVNLQNYIISDNTKTAKLPAFIIKKDSFVILTSTSNQILFSKFGKTFGLTNFPSLNNDLDTIVLYNADQQIVHAVAYNETWFANGAKQDGGWSLELIDADYPFAGKNNWAYSTNILGASAGKENSIKTINHDTTLLSLLDYEMLGKSQLQLNFNKAMSAKFVASKKLIHFQDANIIIDSISLTPPMFQQLNIYVQPIFKENILYECNIDSILTLDNKMSTPIKLNFGVPSKIDFNNIVINEILFNPLPFESKFIELYNNSEHIFDIQHLYIAKYAYGLLKDITKIINEKKYLYPKAYMVLCSDPQRIIDKYSIKNNANVIKVNLPSFAESGDTLVIVNRSSEIIDKMFYSTKWHHPFLYQTEGVALEKIYYTLNGIDKNSWHSAAYPAYASPMLQNSQFAKFEILESNFSISNYLLTPNNDGINDFVNIQYHFKDHGNLVSIRLFSQQGVLVKTIIQNELLGLNGFFQWSGLDENGILLSSGAYVLLINYVNHDGNTFEEKFSLGLGIN